MSPVGNRAALSWWLVAFPALLVVMEEFKWWQGVFFTHRTFPSFLPCTGCASHSPPVPTELLCSWLSWWHQAPAHLALPGGCEKYLGNDTGLTLLGLVITKPCMKVVAGPLSANLEGNYFHMKLSWCLLDRKFPSFPMLLPCIQATTERGINRWRKKSCTLTWSPLDSIADLILLSSLYRNVYVHDYLFIDTAWVFLEESRPVVHFKLFATQKFWVFFLLGTSEQMENAAGAANVFLPLGKLVTVTCLSCLFWHFAAWNCSVT